MNPMVIAALAIGGLMLIGVLMFGMPSSDSAAHSTIADMQAPTTQQPSNSANAQSSLPVSTAAATATQQDEGSDAMETIEVTLGDFFFEGPEGRSGPKGKNGPFDEPSVVLKLKNGEPVRLKFVNISTVVTHQVVSALFGMPEEEVFVVLPQQELEIEITPNFKDVDDGETLRFNLTCHERHRTNTDHYHIGMRAIIEIIP